jgi:hypothetical protein
MAKKQERMVDQYHIDIIAIDKLSRTEVKEISLAFKDIKWFEKVLLMHLPTLLRKKLKIEITR